MLAIDIAIIIQVRKNCTKKKNGSEERFYSQKCKQLKIFYLATDNLLVILKIRGGEEFVKFLEDYVDVAYENCIKGTGLRYVNNHRIQQLVYSVFKFKAKNGVVFITKNALCYLIDIYGLGLPAFLIPVPDFIGISS